MCSYSGGCRCDTCKIKQRDRMRKYVAGRKERDPNWARTYKPRARTAGRSNAKRPQSPLRGALQSHDIAAVCHQLRMHATLTPSGCWEWPELNRFGYPSHGYKGLHRDVLEAKHGAPLGVQQAHHMCGNRTCVNPDHLQPITHRENLAEMHQRRTYMARIAELEEALTEVAPDHPALNTVPVL